MGTGFAPDPAMRTVRRSIGLAFAAVSLAVFFGARAEPPAGPARTAAEMTMAALQPAPDALRLSPEVTAQHSRFAPPGAPVFDADGRQLTELAGVDYRLWMSRGRASFGVGVGTLGYLQPGPGNAGGATALVGASPTVSVGMRYRMTKDSAVFADALGAPGLPPQTSGGYVNTKVGLEWKPATSRFGFDHGALGMHLDSGYRLSLKARHGGVGVYLRGDF